MLEEAQGEAERAFGNPAVFLERCVRAKHLEVQVLGDRKGNVASARAGLFGSKALPESGGGGALDRHSDGSCFRLVPAGSNWPVR